MTAAQHSQPFVVLPYDATCALEATGIKATVSFGDNSGPRRWVNIRAGETTGTVTVDLTCSLDGHTDAQATFKATFKATEPACSQALDVAASGVTRRGKWTSSCTSSQRGNAQTPYYAKRYTFTLSAESDVTVALMPDDNAPAYLDLLPPGGAGVKPRRVVGLNPRISAEGLPAGTYTIETTHRDPRTAGAFAVAVAAAAVTAPAPAACSTTDLGVLGLDEVMSGGVWSASSGCVSLRRGSTDSPHYAQYFTFTLKSYSNVTIYLKSSQNTYLYLLSGHGAGGRVLTEDGDADDTTPNTQLSRDLSAGKYTIEATTFESEVKGPQLGGDP